MQVDAYLTFNRQCEEAFNFYAQVLGGKIEFMSTFEGSPMAAGAPPDWQKKIMHATLGVGTKKLYGSDAPPGRYSTPAGFSISAGVADPAEAERLFHAMAEGGTVQMPIQETFWSPRFGMLTDRFGIPWMVNCDPKA
jgi:PhnB protein